MTAIVFLLLKVAEVAAVVFLPWAVGHAFCRRFSSEDDSRWVEWLVGLAVGALGAGVYLFLTVVLPDILPAWISTNWEWAEALAR